MEVFGAVEHSIGAVEAFAVDGFDGFYGLVGRGEEEFFLDVDGAGYEGMPGLGDALAGEELVEGDVEEDWFEEFVGC